MKKKGAKKIFSIHLKNRISHGHVDEKRKVAFKASQTPGTVITSPNSPDHTETVEPAAMRTICYLEQKSMANLRRELFGWSAFYHRALGLWPEDDQFLGAIWWVKSYIVVLVAIGALVFHSTCLIKRPDDIDLTEFILEAFVAILAISKIVPIVINRTNVLKILTMTLEIDASLKETLEERVISDRWINLQNRLTKFFVKAYVGTVILYFAVPWLTKQSDPFPLKGYMPDFVYATPCFQIVYFIEVLIYTVRFVGVLSCDLYCIAFICQLCSELQIVQYKLSTVKRNDRRSLIRTIRRHAKALELGRMICDNFSIIFLLQHVVLSMVVCFSGINALYTDNLAVTVKMIFFVLLGLVECFFICLIGEKVNEESLKVASNLEQIYVEFSGDVEMRKLMYFMYLRAQKPLELKFAKRSVINLHFYCETLKALFSLSTVFKTMMK